MANQSKTENLFVIMEPGFESLCGFDPANVVIYKPYYAKGTRAKAYRCYKTQGPVGSRLQSGVLERSASGNAAGGA